MTPLAASKTYSPREAAHIWIDHGVSVIPIRTDGSKAPTIKWDEFKTRIMTHDEVDQYFHGHVGIGIVCGKVSGNLEIVDVESEANQVELGQLWEEHLPNGFMPTLTQMRTPSSGRHVCYRCAQIEGNQKLAQRPKPADAPKDWKATLIETRGEGGYVVAPTSPPECHKLNKPYELVVGKISSIPTITAEQREILLSCCRSFNRLIKETERPAAPPADRSQGKRPGDDYNARGDALAVLLKHGWKIEGRKNGSAYLRRPGKDHGISATFGHVAPNTLYVFSSNAAPFDMERAYDAFGIYLHLEAGGDTTRATRELREQGFGAPLEKPAVEKPKPQKNTENPPPLAPEPDPPPLDDEAGAYGMMVLTERNVAQAFQVLYGEQYRYCKGWKTWLDWDSSRWAPEGTDKAFDAIVQLVHSRNREMTKGPAKASFASGVEKIARAARKFATRPEDWDRDTWLFNTSAGVIDLRDGRMRPHRKDDLISKVAAVSPSDAPRPIFDRFLRDITLEDTALAGYLQRSLGACCSGAQSEPFILFWFGNGAAGKNTLWDLVRWILGGYAKTVPIDTLLSRRDDRGFETLAANLLSLRLAISSEVPEGAFFDEQKLKSLSGDATIPGRFLYGSHFDFPKTHKHLIVGNDAPQLRVVDTALRRRLHVVPFRANFEGTPDTDMPAKLKSEGPQVLQWLLAGHAMWLEDGMLHKCQCVQDATDKYFAAQSTPALWIEECCVESSDARAGAKSLYLSYKSWKEARGEGAISQTRLGEYLSKRYDKIKSSGTIFYQGLELRPQSVLDFQPNT